MIKKLDEIIEAVKVKGKRRLVAAYANDSHTIGAASMAMDLGIIEATLVGDIDTIKKVCEEEGIDVNKFKLVQEANEQLAANIASIKGFECIDIDMVLEGGSVEVDGKGTLIAAKSSVVGTERNTNMSIDEVEKYLKKYPFAS